MLQIFAVILLVLWGPGLVRHSDGRHDGRMGNVLIHNADAAGILWPGFTPGILVLFGSGLAGLGMWGRQRNRQGTSIDGLYLALGVRDVNYRGTSIFFTNKMKGGRR